MYDVYIYIYLYPCGLPWNFHVSPVTSAKVLFFHKKNGNTTLMIKLNQAKPLLFERDMEPYHQLPSGEPANITNWNITMPFFVGKLTSLRLGHGFNSETNHYQRVENLHFPRVFLWFSHFPMIFLWFSYEFSIFLWFSHVPMIFPWFSHELSIFPASFPMGHSLRSKIQSPQHFQPRAPHLQDASNVILGI